MEKVKVELEVPKEIHEAGQVLGEIIIAAKEALKDGFQPGTDLPALLVAAVSKLPKAIDGIDKLPAEAVADPVGVAESLALNVSMVVKALLAKPQAPVA